MRYEIGVDIETCYIVFLHGPFPYGRYPDLRIFELALFRCVNEGKSVVEGAGYTTVKFLRPSTVPTVFKNVHGRIRAGHEFFNRRMEQFRVLETTFRQNPHSICFDAIANLTHLMLEISDPLFDILTICFARKVNICSFIGKGTVPYCFLMGYYFNKT